jgi:hypothetical protein
MSQELFDQLTAQSAATFSAKVLADSVNPWGTRLTTMEWTYPRLIHSEIMTHREFSKNSASSRAIPLEKMAKRIETNPFFWLHWGKGQKGMQAERELTQEEKLQAAAEWMIGRDVALERLLALKSIGVHKQIGNRITEPWMWITIIISHTNWENLFALRCHPEAEPHFQKIAYAARTAYDASQPKQLYEGEWHLPLFGVIGDDEIASDDRPKVSAGRCGRVSYLTHMGVRDPDEDIRLYNDLATKRPMHATPLEHPAQVRSDAQTSKSTGNFGPGWYQFRKMHKGEYVSKRAA